MFEFHYNLPRACQQLLLPTNWSSDSRCFATSPKHHTAYSHQLLYTGSRLLHWGRKRLLCNHMPSPVHLRYIQWNCDNPGPGLCQFFCASASPAAPAWPTVIQSSKVVLSRILVRLSGFSGPSRERMLARGASAGCLYPIHISRLILRLAATGGIWQFCLHLQCLKTALCWRWGWNSSPWLFNLRRPVRQAV